jgi:DNA modification methylase
MPRRVVIETSNARKANLDLFLQDQGTSLSEWFNDRVAEAIAPYGPQAPDIKEQLRSLNELRDDSAVMRALHSLDWSFADADTAYLSHNLHPYPAKFIPQIPRHLVAKLSLPGELVWDPFGGSGTTALEALLLHRQAVSSDVNPIATLVARAKSTPLTQPDREEIESFIRRAQVLSRDLLSLGSTLETHRKELQEWVPPIPNRTRWFHENAIYELALLRRDISRLQSERCRILAGAVFSKIILRASFQDNETRYASRPRQVAPCSVIRAFVGELQTAVGRVQALPATFGKREALFLTSDIRHDQVLPDGSVDLVVTSPPYPNATDYHLYHRFRLYWLGFDPVDLSRKEIGSHLRHQKEKTGIDSYTSEMRTALGAIFRALRPGRFAVLVVGDSVFKGRPYHLPDLLSKEAAGLGFGVLGHIPRILPSNRRSFVSAARRLKGEWLLVLRKPPVKDKLLLTPPAYRLWPYEEYLREAEIRCMTGQDDRRKSKNTGSALADHFAADKLRRLTFTHSFASAHYSRELTWQAILENGDASKDRQTRKDPKYATHGLHEYKGKFYPQLAKSLFNLAGLEPGDTVLDPFCGSGTVLLEAFLNGYRGFGIDMNPLAIEIARAKVGILAVESSIIDDLLSDLLTSLRALSVSDRSTTRAFPDEIRPELEAWFPTRVLAKLSSILELVEDIPQVTVRDFCRVCLSNIIREVSHQDPGDLRIRRRKTPLKDAPVVELYIQQVEQQLVRLRHFAAKIGKAPVHFLDAQVELGDSREAFAFQQLSLSPDSVRAVVTSPPYATALPYIDTDRLSLMSLLRLPRRERNEIEMKLTGSREITTRRRLEVESRIAKNDFAGILSATARDTILRIFRLNTGSAVGFRRRNMAALVYRYYEDMSRVLRNMDMVVIRKGHLFFVIGDNQTKAGGKDLCIQSGKSLAEIGSSLGWRLKEVIPITVTREARPHTRNSITENQIVWFQKP